MKYFQKAPEVFVLLTLLMLPIFGSACLPSCDPKTDSTPMVRVLTYSSLGSPEGFLPSIQEDFLADSGCRLEIETTLGATQLLGYLEEPKQQARIDVVMGIDELLFERGKPFLYQVQDPELKVSYLDALQTKAQGGFYPLDYGAMSLIYRKSEFKGNHAVPKSLVDLKASRFKKKFILQDPRSSSPGLMFFLFADSIVSIAELRHQWLLLAPSWESSYQMFLQKDAPMVWSYLTSLAYHASKGEADQYAWVDFQEGLPLQVEGMALMNRVGNPLEENPCIRKLFHFIYRPEIQARLVQKQWMMPVVKGVTLPKDFQAVPEVKRAAKLSVSVERVDKLISSFAKQAQGI